MNQEGEISDNKELVAALTISKKTEILIIIGYSFPIFNREIDFKLLNEMPLKKVYIQSPDGELIKDIIYEITDTNKVGINPQLLNYYNQFYIP